MFVFCLCTLSPHIAPKLKNDMGKEVNAIGKEVPRVGNSTIQDKEAKNNHNHLRLFLPSYGQWEAFPATEMIRILFSLLSSKGPFSWVAYFLRGHFSRGAFFPLGFFFLHS